MNFHRGIFNALKQYEQRFFIPSMFLSQKEKGTNKIRTNRAYLESINALRQSLSGGDKDVFCNGFDCPVQYAVSGAARDGKQLISKTLEQGGRGGMSPADSAGRPAGEGPAHRTQSKAGGAHHQEVLRILPRPGGPDFHRDHRFNQGGIQL